MSSKCRPVFVERSVQTSLLLLNIVASHSCASCSFGSLSRAIAEGLRRTLVLSVLYGAFPMRVRVARYGA